MPNPVFVPTSNKYYWPLYKKEKPAYKCYVMDQSAGWSAGPKSAYNIKATSEHGFQITLNDIIDLFYHLSKLYSASTLLSSCAHLIYNNLLLRVQIILLE